MKNILIYFVFISVVTVLEIGCIKKPKNVILTSDKTIVEKGKFVTLTVQCDGKARWINFHQKNPYNSVFSDVENGNPWGSTAIKIDSLGVYTFYSIAYACDNNGNYDKLKKCKTQSKSNEISVTAIVPCSECDSLYRYAYLNNYFTKLQQLTNGFQTEPTKSMVDSSHIYSKESSDILSCWAYFSNFQYTNYNLYDYLLRLQYDSTLTEQERNYYISLNTYCDFYPIALPGKIQIKSCQ